MTSPRTAVMAILAASVAAGTAVHAQIAGDGRSLSLGDAISAALARGPVLRAERTGIDAARGTVMQASLRPNPMVSMTRQEEPAGTDNQTNVTVEWPLDLFRRAARIGAAEQELEAVRLRVTDRERTVIADVRQAYGEAVTAGRALGVTDAIVSSLARQQDLVGARVDQGSAPPIDRDVLAVELRRLQADRLLQAARVQVAMIQLKRVIGLAPRVPIRLPDTLESLVSADASTPSTPGPSAIGQRSDVRAAAADIRVADRQIERARRNGRLDVTLFGTYLRMDAGFPQLGFNQAGTLARVHGVFHYVAAGASVTVPLRDRNQGDVATAEAQLAGATARLEAVQLDAEAEMASARALDERAHAAVRAYEADVRPLARSNLDIVTETYQLGRGTMADVLLEQRRFLDVERAYTDALKQAFDARTALQRALGERP